MSKPNSLINATRIKEEVSRRNKIVREKLGLQEVDLTAEILKLDKQLKDLENEYEHFFSGMIKILPNFNHNKFKRELNRMVNLPFKHAADTFKIKTIEQRYQVLNTYWQRIIFEKENGTYKKDIFLKELREKHSYEAQRSLTKEGKQSKQLEDLYSIYKRELEKKTGKACNIDINKFKENIKATARNLQQQYPGQKIKFKIVLNDNKVSIKGEVS